MMPIREAGDEDIKQMVKILQLNDQLSHPQVDGEEAMKRVIRCEAACFLVYEKNGQVYGFIRGVYDGSRAVIHQLSVDPKRQDRGIGTSLVKEIVERFKRRGAPTASAMVGEESLEFWEKVGFWKKAFLVGNW